METSLPNEARNEAFARVLGVAPGVVEAAVLNNRTVGEASLDRVLENLAGLLQVGKLEALELLGLSRSRKSKNPTMNVELLDRTYSALDLYARVAGMTGKDGAQTWFGTPKEALDGARPIDLLETRVGLRELQGVVTALEDGAYL